MTFESILDVCFKHCWFDMCVGLGGDWDDEEECFRHFLTEIAGLEPVNRRGQLTSYLGIYHSAYNIPVPIYVYR